MENKIPPFDAGNYPLIYKILGKKLTLNGDSIEYSASFFSKWSIKRNTIKGVRSSFGNASTPSGITLVLFDDTQEPLYLPQFLQADKFFDSWIASLPYLGGMYFGVPLNEDEAEWDPSLHTWMPNREKSKEMNTFKAKTERLKKVDMYRSIKNSAMGTLAMAIAFALFSIIGENSIIVLEKTGVRVEGSIVGFTKKSYTANFTKHYDSYAVIEAKHRVNLYPHNFEIRITNDSYTYHVGDDVNVLYPPNIPERAIIDSCPTLVLNADYRPLSYFPLSLWSWQEAVKAVFLDRVNIVSEYDAVIHSPSFQMKVPSVIALKEYVQPKSRPAFTRFNVFLRDKWMCQYCGERHKTHELTFDHLIPKSRGGTTTWENILTACQECNLLKGNYLPAECRMFPLRKPFQPSNYELQVNGRAYPPNFLHESWNDYLYWDTELELG